MRFVLLAASVVLSFAALGCSGSSDDKAPAAAPTSAATIAPTTAPAPTLATLATALQAGAPAGSSLPPRVNGVVASVIEGSVKLQDGTTFTLAPNARISRLQAIKAGDLAVGQFVAITAKRQPDNTLLASVVSIFPDSLKNVVPGGERPLPEGNLMTNATIDSISGNNFTVAFTGGGSRITLAPDAVLIKQIDASATDLTPGARINANANNGTATSVYVQ